MAKEETGLPKLERYKFEVAPQEWLTGARMTAVRDETIGPEDFFISRFGAQRTVRLMVPNITARVVTSYDLADVEAAEAKQLFATYEKLLAAEQCA
jgi:hypothetical protein